MTPKTSNRDQKLFLWSGIVVTFLLLTTGTLFLRHHNRSPLEPIMIYKAVPIGEVNANRSTSERAKADTQSLSNEGKRPSNAHTHDGHTHAGHTHDEVATSELQETTTLGALISPNHTYPETEVLTPEELDALAHQSWHEKWEKEMVALTAELNAKYPDLVELSSIPLEEWQARYPTKEAFDALGERIDAMQSEFKARFRTLVAEMPFDHQIEYITLLGDVAAQKWGDEVANQIVGDLIANLE